MARDHFEDEVHALLRTQRGIKSFISLLGFLETREYPHFGFPRIVLHNDECIGPVSDVASSNRSVLVLAGPPGPILFPNNVK